MVKWQSLSSWDFPMGFGFNLVGGALMSIFSNHHLVAWIFMGIGCLLIIQGLLRLIPHLRLYSSWSFKAYNWWPFLVLIKLDRASQIAFEKTRGFAVEVMAQGTHPDDPVSFFTYALVDYAPCLYGTETPSTIFERLSANLKGFSGYMEHGAYLNTNVLKKGQKTYDNLMIERKYLIKYIDHARTLGIQGYHHEPR